MLEELKKEFKKFWFYEGGATLQYLLILAGGLYAVKFFVLFLFLALPFFL